MKDTLQSAYFRHYGFRDLHWKLRDVWDSNTGIVRGQFRYFFKTGMGRILLQSIFRSFGALSYLSAKKRTLGGLRGRGELSIAFSHVVTLILRLTESSTEMLQILLLCLFFFLCKLFMTYDFLPFFGFIIIHKFKKKMSTTFIHPKHS